MKLLTLDPSSVAVGWAVFEDGRLMKTNFVHALGAFPKRIQFLIDCVHELIFVYQPNIVAIEMHEGLPFARNSRGKAEKRSAQTTATLCHGQGAIFGALLHYPSITVEIIGDSTWIKKRNKRQRSIEIHSMFPQFAPIWAEDDGMDAADAVGIGLTWYRAREAETLANRPGAKSLTTKIEGVTDGK